MLFWFCKKKHSEELFPSDFIQDNPIASLGPDLLQFLPKYFKETSASQDWPKKLLHNFSLEQNFNLKETPSASCQHWEMLES